MTVVPGLSRRRWLAAAGGTLAALASGGAAAQTPAPPRPPASSSLLLPPDPQSNFDAWADALTDDWMRLSPERSTAMQYFDGAEQLALDGQLDSPAADRRAQRIALARDAVRRLDRVAIGALPAAQRVAAATLQHGLRRTLADAPFADHAFAFAQLGGLQVRAINLLTQLHPLRHADDLETWLSRASQLAARVDATIAQSRIAAARGLVPPRFIVERSRAQVEAFAAPAAAENLLVLSLTERTAALPTLAPELRQRAVDRATRLVDDEIRPAWRRIGAWLDELLPRTGPDAGLWRLFDGGPAYAQALASHTTTRLDAEAIHRIGLAEVERLEGEMDRRLKVLGRQEGSVAERMRALREATRMPAEPDPRPAILERYAEIIRDAEQRAAPLFGLKPRAAVEVRRVPALTERVSSAYYTMPLADGSRPGIFWVPLPGPTFGTLGMRSLAYHEAVPGHHFQLALLQEMEGLPRWRRERVFGGGSAHSEGWALYVERLAVEQGWYEGDPPAELGAWDAQLFRARRLVVDTGLHARRWTRQQAVDYGVSPAEVERYVVNPGQACAYAIGMLRIVELRESAKRSLGSGFSLPAFHDLLLKTGSVPLDVLDGVVKAWVAEAGAASAGESGGHRVKSFGARAAGERLERMRASPRWIEAVDDRGRARGAAGAAAPRGGFRNLAPIRPGLRDAAAPRPTLSDFVCGGKRRVPNAPLPSADPRDTWRAPPSSGLRATWIGHSTVLIEVHDGDRLVRLLTDPVWGARASPSQIAGPKRFQPAAVPLAALPPIDAVLLSHDHYDHLCLPTTKALAKTGVPFVTSLGVGAHLEAFGVRPDRIVELDWWQTHRLPNCAVEVTAAPSQHFSGRGLADRNATLWSSLVVETATQRVFFSGDTGLTDQYRAIRDRFAASRPFDLVMLEVGAFHPSWGDIHLGPENALEALALLGGGAFLPVHWGTFSLAMHAWDEPAETLLERAPARGVQLVMPMLGEAVEPSHFDGVTPWWRKVGAQKDEPEPEPMKWPKALPFPLD